MFGLPFILAMISLILLYIFLSSRKEDGVPPGPPKWPVIGSIPYILGAPFLMKLSELRKQYGDIVYFTLGAEKMLVVFGNKLIREQFQKGRLAFNNRPNWIYIANSHKLWKGIVWANGGYHRELTRFTSQILRQFGIGRTTMEEKIQTEVDVVVQELSALQGKPSDPFSLLRQAAANLICGVLFGERLDYSDPDFRTLLIVTENLTKNFSVQDPSQLFPILRYLPQGQGMKEIDVDLQTIANYIRKRIEEHEKTFDSTNMRDMLDIYLKAKQDDEAGDHTDITVDSIFHTARDLLLAGSDSTSYQLHWVILFMIVYPDVQARCRQEILQIVTKKGRIRLEDRKDTPYIMATINETLRFTAQAVVMLPHATSEETTLGGYRIPKNTMVINHLQSVLHDCEYWGDPQVFRPERFLGENGLLVHHSHFYPFSIGARACTGESMARSTIFLFLCSILQRFNLTAPEGEVTPRTDGHCVYLNNAAFPYTMCANLIS